MSIISKLNTLGVSITPTKSIFCGYKNTECGTTSYCDVDEYDKKVYFLELKKEGKRSFSLPCANIEINIQNSVGEVIFTFKTYDLYAEYYNFNEDENLEYYFKYRYGKRTRKYIEAVMKNIGLVNYTDASNGSMSKEGDPTDFQVTNTYRVYGMAETEVGEIEDNMWIAQTTFRCDIDDFAVIKMYFNHKPTKKDIETAFAIRELDGFNGFKGIPEVCWDEECKHKINWLDISGNLKEKYEEAKRRHEWDY